MMNLRALDPAFTSVGKVGMKSGGALEKGIWDEFAGRREALAEEARRIRDALDLASQGEFTPLPDAGDYEGEEGGLIDRVHKRYERDAKLIAQKKKAAKARGSLACEVCEFDFSKRYGALGAEYIEVHHTKPVHTMKRGEKTALSDLALLCSNCHRDGPPAACPIVTRRPSGSTPGVRAEYGSAMWYS